MDNYDTLLRSAAADLLMARERINAEIAAYPTPVSGCDVQYTHLLAERRKVNAAPSALRSDVFIATPRTLFAGAGVEQR